MVGGSSSGGSSGRDFSVVASSAPAGVMTSSLAPSLPPAAHSTHMGDEHSDLEELEQFARTFKQRRIKLGFTQVAQQRMRASPPDRTVGFSPDSSISVFSHRET